MTKGFGKGSGIQKGSVRVWEHRVGNGNGRGSKKEDGVIGHLTGSVGTACGFLITGS